MDRFNELMRLVYVNRKFNGVAFDAYMLRYIKYKRNKRSPTPAAVTPAATVVVYSDFNMQAIMEQAELQGQVDDTNNENELFHDDVDNDSMDDNDRIRPTIAATIIWNKFSSTRIDLCLLNWRLQCNEQSIYL
jgi:hypothetical protein